MPGRRAGGVVEDPLRALLLDPDREHVPEARPVVSVHGGEEPELRAALARRTRLVVELVRRGVSHGRIAELDARDLLPPRPRPRRRAVVREQRWRAAQPIPLPGAVAPPADLARRADALARRLAAPGGLPAWLDEHGVALSDAAVPRADPERADPERDLARAPLAPVDGLDGLWAKVGRLSTHPGDASLRVRLGFGREGADDASADEARHRAVAALGRRLLPGAEAAVGPGRLRDEVERLAGGPVLATQPIAYWNAPGGGARFHHDAFGEAEGRLQLGVLYVQLTGRTAWLALSIEELGLRVRELVAWLEGGEAPWLAAELEGADLPLARLRELVDRRGPLLAELARPGCGALGPLVDGPAFTAFLADAGHALVVRAGDALLLPNHGPDRTAMHSVFCASERPAYGLSLALRAEERA